MPKRIAEWNPARDVWEEPTTGLFCEHSDVYSATWPASGMTRAGVAYALPTLAPRTDDSGCSSLLTTPIASDANTATADNREAQLCGQVLSLLPTPAAYDGDRGGSQDPAKRAAGGHSITLQDVAEHLLPTPSVADGMGGHINRSGDRKDELLLPGIVLTLLPTPRSAADRTSRTAATRRDSMSAPSLGQAVEIAQGILPREFETWDELPPSWHGDLTNPPSDGGNAPSDE